MASWLMSLPEHLRAAFPGLVPADCDQTSPPDARYNCIAFAAGDLRRAWWPHPKPYGYWPHDAPRVPTLAAFEAAYRTLGYERCESEALEDGLEKVAIFVDAGQVPTHAARQLPDGIWTSKLGQAEDIRHPLRQIEGATYGTVALVMSRKQRATANP
jgi:hypothetical protein